jgi:hypothetical protein
MGGIPRREPIPYPGRHVLIRGPNTKTAGVLACSLCTFVRTRCRAVKTWLTAPAASMIRSVVPGKYSWLRESCNRAPDCCWSCDMFDPPRPMMLPAAALETRNFDTTLLDPEACSSSPDGPTLAPPSLGDSAASGKSEGSSASLPASTMSFQTSRQVHIGTCRASTFPACSCGRPACTSITGASRGAV